MSENIYQDRLPYLSITPGGTKRINCSRIADCWAIYMGDPRAMEQALDLKEALQNSLYDVQAFIKFMEDYK
jgi:hypothetical protein